MTENAKSDEKMTRNTGRNEVIYGCINAYSFNEKIMKNTIYTRVKSDIYGRISRNINEKMRHLEERLKQDPIIAI